MIGRGVATKLWLVLGLLVGIALGTVATQALVERRSPTDVIVGYAMPFVSSPQSYFHKDRVALLLLGIDYSYDRKDQEYSAGARSDTIKAVALNLPTADSPTGSISLLSVPRDMEYVYPNGHADKINSAYGTGHDSASSARASERAVSQFLGVPGFDRYLTLRIDATKDVVDAIGGIDVVPDETMNYDDSWGHLHIHFVGGRHYHMNGEQAVSYARFRHDACSDPCRIKRQDQIIRITLAKLKNDRFNDLVHVRELIDVVRRNVYTDLSQQEILSLALAFQHVDLKAIRTDQVPYTSDRELTCCGDVLIADDVAKAKLVATAFAAPPPGAAPAAVVARIHVDVRNGSGVTGQGRRLAASLRKAGFVVDSVSNAARVGYGATEIRVHRAVLPLAGERVRAAIALPSATVEPDPAPASPASSDVTVIVGRDYATSSTDPRIAAMTRERTRTLAAVVAIVAFVGGASFVVRELGRPPTPAIVTRDADAHHLLSPSLGAHISRLLNDRIPNDRRDSPRLVAFTFDDGPYPVETPLLLDVLRRERVPATFFLIGDDTTLFPALAKRIEADGNEIANHTQTHPARFDELDAKGVDRELRDGAATLDRYVHDPAIHTLMRPPHGRFTERTVVAAQRAGYAVVLWNDDPGDWRAVATPDVIAAHVGRYATAPEILLLHSGRLDTVRAMPELIRRFRAAGFSFVTVGELMRKVPTVRIEHPERVRV